MFKQRAQEHHINPRFRAYGKARIDIAQRAQSREDWLQMWKEPTNPFPFTWGENWKQCVEYKVDDFAAEVGFFIDILGLPVNAFDPDYAMFTSPTRDFYISVVPAFEDEASTPPDALRIQFMVEDIFETVEQLESRGVIFEQQPQPCQEGSSLYIAYFRTPHGISVDLWGFLDWDDDENLEAADQVADFLDQDPEEIDEGEAVAEYSSARRIRREASQEEGKSEPADSPHANDDAWDEGGEGDDDIAEEPRYTFDDEEDNSFWRIRYS